jgi:hypothetical protein
MLISARLLPAVRIGNNWISIEPTDRADLIGKPEWNWYIDLADRREFYGSDLNGWGDAGDMMESLLGFLGAFAESFPDGENADLFPKELGEWAQANSDEIAMLESELFEQNEERNKA